MVEEKSVKIAKEDRKALGDHPKRKVHQLIENEPNLKARIKELEAQLETGKGTGTSISEEKRLELIAFELGTIQQFCDFSYLDPNLLYYVCGDKLCPIHLPRNRRLTNQICKLCHEKRQAMKDATSEYGIYIKAVGLAGGRRNISLVTGLSKQVQMMQTQRDKARANAKEWETYHSSTVEKLKESHKKNMDDLEASHKEQIKIRASHENKLTLENMALKNQFARVKDWDHFKETVTQTENKLTRTKVELRRIQSQKNQAEARLSEIKDAEAIIRLVTSNPDWGERFQTIEATRKQKEELERTERTIYILCLERGMVTLDFCLHTCEKYIECPYPSVYSEKAKEFQMTAWEKSTIR